MDVEFELRAVGEAQIADLLALYRQCEDFLALGPAPVASVAMIRGDLAASGTEGSVFCGIYDRSGLLVGVIDFSRGGYRGDSTLAHIALVMLAQSHRGRGLGTRVVHAVETIIWQGPAVRGIAVEVQANNLAGMRFWTRRGYRVVGAAALQVDGTTTVPLLREREQADP